jgi:hypothetical protein
LYKKYDPKTINGSVRKIEKRKVFMYGINEEKFNSSKLEE